MRPIRPFLAVVWPAWIAPASDCVERRSVAFDAFGCGAGESCQTRLILLTLLYMTDKNGPKIPATSMLITFERVARLGSMTHAARELGAPVSSVSRCISMLERQLSIRLFERTGAGMRLTEPARRYYENVHGALGLLQSGTEAAAELAGDPSVVIACSHDASHLLIMPRYPDIESLLGAQARIRVLTYQRHIHELPPVDVPDIVLSWQASDASTEDRVLVLKEEVRPVCSPAFLHAHAPIAQGNSTGWGDLTLLDLKRPNMGWATWRDWFATAGQPETPPHTEDYDTYTQVLKAAAAGRGIALGWKHCIEAYLDRGALVALHDRFVPFGGSCVAALTAKGQGNPLAHRCMEFFAHFD